MVDCRCNNTREADFGQNQDFRDITMGKTARIFLALTGTALVGVVIAVWLLASNLDGIVKRIIEEAGSNAFGTYVALNSAAIDLAEAKATLTGLTIANPKGFNERNAFKLGGIEITLDPATVTGNEIVIPSVIISQAALTFEQIGSNNNLQALMNHLNSGSDSGSKEDDEILIVIEELQLNGASMTIIADQVSKPLSLILPDITVRNIGRRGAGVTPDQAAEAIIQPILKQAQAAATNRVKNEAKDLAREKADEQKDKQMESAQKKLFGG
jgi:UDP-N-acetylglucosamine enolpyruvyl transferase